MCQRNFASGHGLATAQTARQRVRATPLTTCMPLSFAHGCRGRWGVLWSGGWPMDPRAPQLGQRALLPRAAEPALDAPLSACAAHRQWRIQQGVAEGASEIPSGKLAVCRSCTANHVMSNSGGDRRCEPASCLCVVCTIAAVVIGEQEMACRGLCHEPLTATSLGMWQGLQCRWSGTWTGFTPSPSPRGATWGRSSSRARTSGASCASGSRPSHLRPAQVPHDCLLRVQA